MKKLFTMFLCLSLLVASSISSFASSDSTFGLGKVQPRLGGGPSHIIVDTDNVYLYYDRPEVAKMMNDLDYPNREDWVGVVTSLLGIVPDGMVSTIGTIAGAIYSGDDYTAGGFKENVPFALGKGLAESTNDSDTLVFKVKWGMYETGEWVPVDGPFFVKVK